MNTLLMNKVFSEPLLLESLARLHTRENPSEWKEFNRGFVEYIMSSIQDILGGQINKVKSEYTLVKSTENGKKPEPAVVLNPNTGDDSATVIAINHSIHLFSKVRRESRVFSLTLGKQLVTIEYINQRWIAMREGRTIPRLVRAVVSATTSTLPYAPMADKSLPHPLIVLENNIGNQLTPFWGLIREFIAAYFSHVDVSALWLSVNMVPDQAELDAMLCAEIDIKGIKEIGHPLRGVSMDRREERAAIILEGLKMVKSNAKAEIAWRTKIEGLMCENFLHPPIRRTRKEVNFLVINSLIRTYKSCEKNHERVYEVPEDFLAEYAEEKDAVLGEKSLSLSATTKLLIRMEKTDDAVVRIMLDTDASEEVANVVIHLTG